MNIFDLIAKVDKSDKNEDYVAIEDFSELFGINAYDLELEPNRKLKCYWAWRKMDTDTHVGLRIYYLDNAFVATSWEQARKSGGQEIEFLDQGSAQKVKEYILELRKEIVDNIDYIDTDEAFGVGLPVHFGEELLTSIVYHIPSKEYVTVVRRWGTTYDIKLWNFVEIEFNKESKFSQSNKLLVNLKDILVPFNVNNG